MINALLQSEDFSLRSPKFNGDTEIEKVTNNKRKVIPPPALIVDDKGDTWVPHHNPNKPPRKRKPGQCPHARQKDRCKDCGGSAICVHGKQKRFCRACDGSAFCPHGRQKARCKECGGSSICMHGRQKNRCKECGGTGICIHRREKAVCKDCGGLSLCIHGRQKATCKQCGGANVCTHGKRKALCKDCGEASLCVHGKQKRKCSECSLLATTAVACSNSSKMSLLSERQNKTVETLNGATQGLLELAMIASVAYECVSHEGDIMPMVSSSLLQANLPIKKRKLSSNLDSSTDTQIDTSIYGDNYDKNALTSANVKKNTSANPSPNSDTISCYYISDSGCASSENGNTSNEDADIGEVTHYFSKP